MQVYRNFHRIGVLQNDILLNMTMMLVCKTFDINWDSVQRIARGVLVHCVREQFDAQTKRQMLCAAFYLLSRLSFENSLVEALAEFVYPNSGKKDPYACNKHTYRLNIPDGIVGWRNKGSFLYGFLSESWYIEFFHMDEVSGNPIRNKELQSLQLEMINSLLGAVGQLGERMAHEAGLDPQAQVLAVAFERITIECADVCFKLLNQATKFVVKSDRRVSKKHQLCRTKEPWKLSSCLHSIWSIG